MYTLVKILFFIIFYCILCVIFLIILVFIRRIYQAIYSRKWEEARQKLQEDLIHFLFFDDAYINISSNLLKIKKGIRRKVLLSLIVQLYSTIVGAVAEKLAVLYIELDQTTYALKRIAKGRWDAKSRNIRLLSQMKVFSAAPEIEKYVNDQNPILRMEAQMAMVNLNKENPFAFLDELEEHLTDWEQMNIYDIVIRNSVKVPDFSKWLNSKNDSVLIFCLRMIRMFRQREHLNKILELFDHYNYHVRHEAILTAGELSKDETLLSSYVRIFDLESQKNQLTILQNMSHSGLEEYFAFYQRKLHHPDFDVKFESARAIYQSGANGKQILRDILEKTDDDHLKAIISHIFDKRI